MKGLKYFLLTAISAILVLTPLLFMISAVFVLPPAYCESFVGVLDEKFDRLTDTEEEKIIVVGGSSVAFGLDSEALERYTGMPVVSFGLYAALGTRVMLDLSLAGVSEGDVVVVAPEIDREALSLFFGADTVWRAIDGDPSMLRYISMDNMPAMLGALWGYSSAKAQAAFTGDKTEPDGIYLSKYFDGYGDFDYPRPANTMHYYYEKNNPIELDISAYGDELDAFIDYLNEYADKCKKRGASVYFSFSPMNAMATDADIATRDAFEKALEERLSFSVISDIESCILDAGYFFDTNFHLNDAGRTVRTIRLAKDIRLALGLVLSAITDREPEPPELPEINVRFDGYDENSVYFTYRKAESGAYIITGLSDEGKKMKELTIPLGYDGYIVEAIAESAFALSSLESLTVTEESNLDRFDDGAFLGASSLRHLRIYKLSGDDIHPPASFAGVHPDFTVHIPRGSDFPYHYYWSERGLRFSEE